MADSKTIITVEEVRNKLPPLFQDNGLQLVVLFGSVASGKVHKRSDIDLAFLFEKRQISWRLPTGLSDFSTMTGLMWLT